MIQLAGSILTESKFIMKRLLIVGAGAFGREVLAMSIENIDCGTKWEVGGFLDSRKNILEQYSSDYSKLPFPTPATEETRTRYKRDFDIVGDPLTYKISTNDVFICALGCPKERMKYTLQLLSQGADFIRLIHFLAAPAAYSSIGPGSILNPHATLSPDCHIGRFVTVSNFTALAHDVRVGDWTAIGAHCLIAGGVNIGKGVQIHPGSIITSNTIIGDGVIVGAGSVVFGKIPENITVMGNPAKKFNWK